MKIIEKIVNVETGTEEIIERAETAQEKLEREDFERRLAIIKQAEAEAKAKRQALLDKLGITEDEAKLLLGGN